jgi:Zn-dependent protease with chaperone function
MLMLVPTSMRGLLVLALVLLPLTATAQVQVSRLDGRVVDAGGAAVAGATVTIADGLGATVRRTASDASGSFAIADLPPLTSPKYPAAMRLLAELWPPTYYTEFRLTTIVICRMVNISLVHCVTHSSNQGFALLGWVSTQVWFYAGLGVQPNLAAPNSALALLLFMLAVPVFGFFIAPLPARLSRKHEFEADAYAVAQTSGADLSAALLKLYQDNASTLTPDPLFVSFYYSHPPASERLARMTAPA